MLCLNSLEQNKESKTFLFGYVSHYNAQWEDKSMKDIKAVFDRP